MNKLMLVSSAALALSLLGGLAEKAYAVEPAGHSFCKNGMPGGNQELAKKMERSLAADPSGNTKLEGCEATPMEFLAAWQETDKKERERGGLNTVSQLPAFIRKFVPTTLKQNVEYSSACLYDTAGGGRTVEIGCVVRTARKGEVVYVNPDTGVAALMSSCVNPGGAEIEVVVVTAQKCPRVDFPSMGQGRAIRFAYIGPKRLPGRCHEYRLAGVSEPLYETPEECKNSYEKVVDGRKFKVTCSWDRIEQNSTLIMGKSVEVQNVSGSFVTRADGTNSWYLPPEALEGLATICWEMPDGSFRTVSVADVHYVNGVATISAEFVQTAVWK